MLSVGFEPTRPNGHKALNLARLPDFATRALSILTNYVRLKMAPPAGFEPATSP